MRQRRKALIILGFETQDRPLSNVERGWNDFATKTPGRAKIRPSTSMDFLIARDRANKRPGFIEVELEIGETPMRALQRLNPFSTAAMAKPWRQIDSFPYEENDNHWEVAVGIIMVGKDQRAVDLYEQSDELPFLLEWQTPHWLYRQQEDGILNLLTSTAVVRPAVRRFLLTTQQRLAA